MSIQIIAQARKKGITLAPNQLFEYQTIRELAKISQIKKEETIDFSPAASGPAPLTPIQHWFFSVHHAAPHHWNQILMFTLKSKASFDFIRTAVQTLVSRHDALRLAFSQQDGIWNMELKEKSSNPILSRVDLEALDKSEEENFILNSLKSAQETFDLEQGDIFRALWFGGADNNENRLYMICHHLAIDAYSWRIIAEEFSTIIKSLEQDHSPQLPNPTTPYTVYSSWLVEQSGNHKMEKELEFWSKQVQSLRPFPVDFDVSFPVPESSIKVITSRSSEGAANVLLNSISVDSKIKTRELLITAFMLALNDWKNLTEVCLGLEGHGRDGIDESLDLSRTVGWLTTYYPIKINIIEPDNLDQVLLSVKEQLNKVPGSGSGYGMLRYLSKTSNLALDPPVVFNYLGNLNSIEDGVMGKPTFFKETNRHPESERYYHIEVNAMISNGTLETNWSYSEDQYKQDSIQLISTNFEKRMLQLIEWCNNNSNLKNNSVDFPEVNLSKGDLDNLLNQL